MSGTFELFVNGSTSYGFRIKAPNGAIVAVSGQFPDKASAVQGIRAVREYAGMGLIKDLCEASPADRPKAA
ncbi:YegP family protein [Arthrobacter sp.]|uniref:YegP family protein n=1 Tax=Arthrobacter sp. TaxID=1667 RepID=UPI002810D38E|nr:YegP family protein [Arthrobacter sp.]